MSSIPAGVWPWIIATTILHRSTNRLMRGAAVAAGHHRLVYTYEPRSFQIGAWISLAGIVGLCGLGLAAMRWPRANDR